MNCKILYILLGFLLLSCDKQTQGNQANRLSVKSIPVSYTNIVKPDGPAQLIQVYVKDSNPYIPGTIVDIIDLSKTPSDVIVSSTKILSARWKVAGPLSPPKYPANGFITFSLSKNQCDAIKNKRNIIIQATQK